MSKIKNGGLDQYGAERFEQQQFGTAGVEGVNTVVKSKKHRVSWSVIQSCFWDEFSQSHSSALFYLNCIHSSRFEHHCNLIITVGDPRCTQEGERVWRINESVEAVQVKQLCICSHLLLYLLLKLLDFMLLLYTVPYCHPLASQLLLLFILRYIYG